MLGWKVIFLLDAPDGRLVCKFLHKVKVVVEVESPEGAVISPANRSCAVLSVCACLHIYEL